MGVYISDMDLPKNGVIVLKIDTSGNVCTTARNDFKKYNAMELHAHGRLIDADSFLARNAYFADREFVNPKYDDTLKDLVDRANTIIPADREKEE